LVEYVKHGSSNNIQPALVLVRLEVVLWHVDVDDFGERRISWVAVSDDGAAVDLSCCWRDAQSNPAISVLRLVLKRDVYGRIAGDGPVQSGAIGKGLAVGVGYCAHAGHCE
jgi:hypothetical protein